MKAVGTLAPVYDFFFPQANTKSIRDILPARQLADQAFSLHRTLGKATALSSLQFLFTCKKHKIWEAVGWQAEGTMRYLGRLTSKIYLGSSCLLNYLYSDSLSLIKFHLTRDQKWSHLAELEKTHIINSEEQMVKGVEEALCDVLGVPYMLCVLTQT